MPDIIIKATKINKKYGDKSILKDVDFTLEKGTFVAIMGPSGAGKTTFMNVLSGLESCSGIVLVKGEDVSRLKEPKLTKFRRENMSYIFQEYNLIDFLTTKENILLPLKVIKGNADLELYQKLVKTTKLLDHENKKPPQLSGGQKQRVAIVRSIMAKSEIIFADEPTGALDLKTRDQIMGLLTALVKQFNKTLILVTHDPFVASFADRVIFLMDGKIHHEIEKTSSLAIAEIIDDLEMQNV